MVKYHSLKDVVLIDTHCLEKVFIPLELFHILSPNDHKRQWILLGFYVMDHHKVAHNCEVEGK